VSWVSLFGSAGSSLTAVCRSDGNLLFGDIPVGEALPTQGGAADGIQKVCQRLMNGVFAESCVGPHRAYYLPDYGFVFFLGFGQAMGKLLIHLPRQTADRFL
jgi:hypothetical protein